ncbi:hypothetical protein HUJ04_000609 [Dendroctonus ponderosae]|uniref:Uncharacterized protein n=1 Tax=Dendroctonus ponderosae TaxID=77166 RepID=A0AAR5NZC2_DENPD|nr:hypothetical protein HUJ04_000609 [Dendroctonus ponderosae]
MLGHGEVPRYVPNWWNPYSHNVGQKDPRKKQKLIVIVKLVLVVITMLGGAILALCLNIFMPAGQQRSNFSDSDPCMQGNNFETPLNQRMPRKFDTNALQKEETTTPTRIQYQSSKHFLITPYRPH